MTIFTPGNNWLQEVRALLRLAGPLIINNLAIAGMQFADAVMAGRLGAEALAAVAVGGSVWFLGFTVMLGLMMSISPIAARHYGAGNLSLIGRYTRQGLWLAAVLGISIFVLAQLFVEPALRFVGIATEFRDLTIGYVRAIMFGAPAICAFLAFRFTTEGIGHTRPIMYTSLFALVCNVFLNYVLMFGHFGAPAMGVVGCGLASAITMWLIMIGLSVHVYLHPRYRPLQIFARLAPVRIPVIKEIFSLGTPIALTITAEAGLFSAVSILMMNRANENDVGIVKAFIALDDLADLKTKHLRQSCIDHDYPRQQALDRQHRLHTIVNENRFEAPLSQSTRRQLALLDFGICD